jgi:hypothetical protein
MTRGDPSGRRAAPQPLWSSADSPSKSYPLASVAVATRPYGRPVKSWRAWSRWSRRTVQYVAAASRNGSRLSWAKRSWGIFAGGNREMKRESRCLRKPWLSCATQSQPTSDATIRVAPDPECCFSMKGGVCAEVPAAPVLDDKQVRPPRARRSRSRVKAAVTTTAGLNPRAWLEGSITVPLSPLLVACYCRFARVGSRPMHLPRC